MLLYGSGLRLMDALSLRVKDLDLQSREATVRRSKDRNRGRQGVRSPADLATLPGRSGCPPCSLS